jgi:hypothetical protein
VAHEAHDVLSARGRASHTDGEQCHLRSRRPDAELLDPRGCTADELRQLKLFIALSGEQLPAIERSSNSIDDDFR